MATMAKTKVTPCAKHPGRTQEFIKVVQEALETFEDEISSLTDDICGKAYKKYVKAYHDALVPVWRLARFASVNTMMKTITNKNLTEITVMAQCLKPTPPRTKVTKDKTKVPDLETITNALTKKFPGQSLPDTSTCKKIAEVFAKLSAASKAYSEAAEGLSELSTLVTPDQFTMLLTVQGPFSITAHNLVKLLLHCIGLLLNFWGMFVRVYPRIVQGLTFLNSAKHITKNTLLVVQVDAFIVESIGCYI